jgi:hypothetical protein
MGLFYQLLVGWGNWINGIGGGNRHWQAIDYALTKFCVQLRPWIWWTMCEGLKNRHIKKKKWMNIKITASLYLDPTNISCFWEIHRVVFPLQASQLYANNRKFITGQLWGFLNSQKKQRLHIKVTQNPIWKRWEKCCYRQFESTW